MERQTLLIELVTEELPPKSLKLLGETFGHSVFNQLVKNRLVNEGVKWRWFATPRRLAVLVPRVAAQGEYVDKEEQLIPVEIAFDEKGNPTEALNKKLAARGFTPEKADLIRRKNGKREMLFLRYREKGVELFSKLSDWVAESLEALPMPKQMRWGSREARFIRPVHRLVMMWGDSVVPGTVLGLKSDRITLGHRFLSRGEIKLSNADSYEETLFYEGKVISDFQIRRSQIADQLAAAAKSVGGTLRDDPELLDEVTALVECPEVVIGTFDEEFLNIPQECLILTMRTHQKYFPIFSKDGTLLNRFLVVTNMRIPDPTAIVRGNERVIRPRLADARFFFEQDRKAPLVSRLPKLSQIVYHRRIGTLGERVERLRRLAEVISYHLGCDPIRPHRAALLAKCDLVTEMVGEFPELQGVMGRYYALADGEEEEVAWAIEEHYRPKFSGDLLPSSLTGTIVALADKLDTLAGLFAVGEKPTGEKDPYGLRRAALGILRIVLEHPIPIVFETLLTEAVAVQPPNVKATAVGRDIVAELRLFCDERLRHYLREAGHQSAFIEAVLAIRPERVDTIPARIAALTNFSKRSEAKLLAKARKRVVNILKKETKEVKVRGEVDQTLFSETAEKELFETLAQNEPHIFSSIANEDFESALMNLSELAPKIEKFFDQVMVLCDDISIRTNRLALLERLRLALDQVADLSVLEL